MRESPPAPRPKGEAAVDWWTLPHAGAGAALAVLGLGWVWALAVLVAYEVGEAGLRRVPGHDGRGLFEYESWPNITVDVVAAMGTFFLASWALRTPWA